MYTITASDGPDFEEGDEVVFTAGALSGVEGEIVGYDEANEVYFVKVDGQPFHVSATESMLDLIDDEDDDDDLDIPEDQKFNPGTRVIVAHASSPWLGQAGVVMHEDQEAPFHSYMLLMESGEIITIMSASLIESLYQGEILEAVPSV